MSYYTALLLIYVAAGTIRIGINSAKDKKILCFFLLLPAFLLIGFRNYTVGSDTFSYYYIYNNMSNYDSISIPLSRTWMEPGYVLLTYTLSHLGIGYFQFQIIISAFCFLAVYRTFVKYAENIGLSCFLFMTMAAMFGMMNQTRMWISIAICLFSLDSLENKRIARFVLIIIFASSFHMSALILLLAFPLIQMIRRNYLRYSFIVLFVSVIIMVGGRPFFTWLTRRIDRYSIYLTTGTETFSLAAILNLGIDLVIFILVYLKNVHWLRLPESEIESDIDRTEKTQATTAYMFSLMTLGISIIELANSLVSRAIFFYSFPLIFQFPNTIENISMRGNRIIIKTLVIILFALKMYIILVYRPKWDSVLPYEFFWTTH